MKIPRIPHLLPLLLLSLLILLPSCHRDPHFITDKHYRQQVHQDFLQRQELAQGVSDTLFGGMDTLSRCEREALEFLYAYMPYSDLADYDQAFYLQQVRTAFAARRTFSWGRQVPEDIFRHFVLVYRVNNENLDTARMVFYRELKDRVKGLSMEDAALEVNHWCHEHVAYRAADSRTSAPLATMRTSLGRCGEESTFAVTALRAVGIPARQCYTPRWAHCDDNHAWVEVWIASPDGKGGEWKFLGACEPDPELNMGWFAVPSTRCLMVHSKAFGRYHGDEEVVKRTALYSELNLLSHYAPTRCVTATVTDQQGKPLPGATIKFKMYNYAEYYTLATYQADAHGQASLTTGLGDILVWATDGTRYAFSKLDVRRDSTITLTLSDATLNSQLSTLNFDIVPPAPGTAKVTPSDEAVAANARRLAYEDSLRNAYTATFPTEGNFKSYLPKDWLWTQDLFSDAQVWEIVHKSEGNYAEIFKYFETWRGQYRSGEHIYDYLKSYSDKDLRDITADVLQAQETGFDWLNRTKGTCTNTLYTYDVYKKGILPARISNELVRDWRQPLLKAMTDFAYRIVTDTTRPHRLWVKQRIQPEEYKQDYEALKKWTIENIAVDDTGNYYNCPISPMGVFSLRHADPHSRDIFFVAACRAFDIPAYLDNATNIIYVWDGTNWQATSFTSTTSDTRETSISTLTLTYHGKEPAKPIYYPHFTLQKLEDGDFRTFDFEDDPRMATFPATIDLEPGTYCLSTGNRYPDGEVLNRLEFFTVSPGEKVTKEIVICPLVEKEAQSEIPLPAGTEVMEGVLLTDYANGTGAILAFMGPHREPAKHLVKEMLQHTAEFQQWGGMIYCTTTNPDNADLRQLRNIDIVPLHSGESDRLELTVAEALGGGEYEYPLVVFVDGRGNIIFHTTGYKIGLAELLLKYCK